MKIFALTFAAGVAAMLTSLAGVAGPGAAESSVDVGQTPFSLGQLRVFKNEEKERVPVGTAVAPATKAQTTGRSVNGWTYVGGEVGWQLTPHSLVWSGNRFVHSDECDHAIRVVQGPTASEIEEVRRLYPGG